VEDSKEFEILLVEDNPNDVELTLRSLSKHNLTNKIHVVKDGAEALDYIFCTGAFAGRSSGNKPSIILLNLHLPKVDGLEVLRRIRVDERTKTIPVIVLTSSTEERDIVESYELDVNGYIIKPIEFNKFLHTVSEIGIYPTLLSKPPV
jgi:two-component system response regulator